MKRLAIASLLISLAITATADAAKLRARGSVEQAYVTGAKKGERLKLVNRAGKVVRRDRAGSLGGSIFRGVKAGKGYRVRRASGARTRAFRVLPDQSAPPNDRLYKQFLPPGGYGYAEMRDGTLLALNVQLPGPAEDGPYPTLVEYSGYGYARPSGGESSIAQIGLLLGFAVVDVNMRGTGCSGGVFDYFERLQALDGYDIVETVARQPWAMHGKVGMMGISYGGISQLFVASTRPPSLSAITPLSVVDNSATTLYPGGLLNTGFALEWSKDRQDDAQPATATTGQAWAFERIEGGDANCKANQVLHTEAPDLIAKIHRNRFYDPAVADPVSPDTFVDEISVPVFLACQWQDEQTGGHCPALADEFTGTKRKWFTFTNGAHIDSLDPATFNRWYDFLKLYVGRQAPKLTDAQRAAAPVVYSAAMGVENVTLPEDPIQSQPDYDSALAAFEDLPQVRILFENGAGGDQPGAPVPAFERSFSRWPPPGTAARSWYVGADGTLTAAKPAAGGENTFTWDRAARPSTNFTGDTGSGDNGLWTATPAYEWSQNPAGKALSYVSDPLAADTAVVGAGKLQAWVMSSASRLDLQATVSEVRPDGKEYFVQGGWLRTSGRKLDSRRSTELEPWPTFTRADDAPLPAGKWAEVNVPLYYQGHLYRAGSRIRVTVAAPGGDQPIWAFGRSVPKGPASVALSYGPTRASRLVLPVVGGVSAGSGLPPCPGLRGQPCRDYVAFENLE